MLIATWRRRGTLSLPKNSTNAKGLGKQSVNLLYIVGQASKEVKPKFTDCLPPLVHPVSLGIRYHTEHNTRSKKRPTKVHSIINPLTCKSGRRGFGSTSAVRSNDERRDGVKVIRDTLASARIGASRSGSAATPGPGRNKPTPARRGVKTSATKSTKYGGVRLGFDQVCRKARASQKKRERIDQGPKWQQELAWQARFLAQWGHTTHQLGTDSIEARTAANASDNRLRSCRI